MKLSSSIKALLLASVLAACGGDNPAPQQPTTKPTQPPAATTPAPVDPGPAPTTPAPVAETSDPPPIAADKIEAYVAVWKEYFAKENNITPEELAKRVTVKKTESAVRNFSRTFLEVKIDVKSDWAEVHGASSELLTRIKARSSEPPPGVRFDVWLEPSDYASMKKANALITTKYNFGKLRFSKQADAEAAAMKACKSKTRAHDFQVAIAGDGDPWLMSLFKNEKTKENWPCGVDLIKTKGGEIMNFDAGDSAFK